MRISYLLLIVMMAVSPFHSVQAEEAPLPLPRFVSVKSSEANMRRGPGTRYPIQWVYHKASMPVEIIDEYHNWRKVRDVDGEEGWMHKSLLVGTRMAFTAGQTQDMYRKPSLQAGIMARVEPRVLVKLKQCQPRWCEVKVHNRSGWFEKSALWGVYDNEVF